MRKLIDLDESTTEALSIMAIKAKTNLINYIESILVLHARGGFKDKNLPLNVNRSSELSRHKMQ